MSSNGPLCFVLMPFGKKPDQAGVLVDFDAVYEEVIVPAVRGAGMEPLRADEEVAGGILHRPMFERLVLCEYAVADLTTANPAVFYELGVRHGVRPSSTVLMIGGGTRLPFDLAMLRAMPYAISADGMPERKEEARFTLTRMLSEARTTPITDSPLFQLLGDYPGVMHEKTDVFRERISLEESIKQRLEDARQQGIEAVRQLESGLAPLDRQPTGVIVDLFLSYRAVRGWNEMISLVDRMPEPVAQTVLVQEQLALALNRARRAEEAEHVVLRLLEQKGPSSETYGVLGRIYKDRWEAALRTGDASAPELLDQAIEAYLRGFESDWRDAYPGVNAVTLMEIREPPDPRREELVPVVRYAVKRRVAGGTPDYWDHATLLELAVLAGDEAGASEALGNALAVVRESWEPETTARNLRLIREARERRGAPVPWAAEVEKELEKRAAR